MDCGNSRLIALAEINGFCNDYCYETSDGENLAGPITITKDTIEGLITYRQCLTGQLMLRQAEWDHEGKSLRDGVDNLNPNREFEDLADWMLRKNNVETSGDIEKWQVKRK